MYRRGLLIASTPLLLGLFFTTMWLLFGWAPELLLFCVIPGFVPLFFIGMSIAGESKERDPNADCYDTIIDMVRGYPDDWKWRDIGDDSGNRGTRYALHENVIILDGEYYRKYQSGGGYWQPNFLVRVYDCSVEPKKGKKGEKVQPYTDYHPKAGYREAIEEALADLHHYHEMKVLVNVNIDAEERKSPLDTARKALADFQEKKGLNQPETREAA